MPDPIAEFERLLERARRSEAGDATAAALATAGADGRPAVRMVLLKGVDERGFVFYTNYRSRKARQLEENPWAALCFYWPAIGWQARLEGPVRRVSPEESDAYFASRPRGSQLAAAVSRQSEPLASRFTLLKEYLALKLRAAGRPVERPGHWGGYRLAAERVEFWSAQLHRLHDRRVFTRGEDGWRMERLYP